MTRADSVWSVVSVILIRSGGRGEMDSGDKGKEKERKKNKNESENKNKMPLLRKQLCQMHQLHFEVFSQVFACQ